MTDENPTLFEWRLARVSTPAGETRPDFTAHDRTYIRVIAATENEAHKMAAKPATTPPDGRMWAYKTVSMQQIAADW